MEQYRVTITFHDPDSEGHERPNPIVVQIYFRNMDDQDQDPIRVAVFEGQRLQPLMDRAAKIIAKDRRG